MDTENFDERAYFQQLKERVLNGIKARELKLAAEKDKDKKAKK